MLNCEFNSDDRLEWIKYIAKYIRVVKESKDELITISINERVFDNQNEEFKPYHVVSLACFIEECCKLGRKVKIKSSKRVASYLKDILRFEIYFNSEHRDYVSSGDDQVLNLWRISLERKEFYSLETIKYLKRKYFKEKDLSSVENCLNELYYNIFDHSKCNGNAFSFIKVDDNNQKLYIAVCDFGVGIAKSIREYFSDIHDDNDAILKAIEESITVRSKDHNRGYGLTNIIDTPTEMDYMRIISNSGGIIINSNKKRIIHGINDLCFCGTIIDMEISICNFENEEIVDSFDV